MCHVGNDFIYHPTASLAVFSRKDNNSDLKKIHKRSECQRQTRARLGHAVEARSITSLLIAGFFRRLPKKDLSCPHNSHFHSPTRTP